MYPKSNRSDIRVALLASLALGLFLSGCAVGDDYARPETPGSERFKQSRDAAGTPAPAITDDWWKRFGDPELDRLQEGALAANQDLFAAYAAVNRARALVDSADAGFWPTINGRASAQRSRNSGTMSDTVNAGGATRSSYNASASLSYELDVWGRVRRLSESAGANELASETDFAVVRQTVQSDVATTYFNLRGFDSRIGVLTRTIALFEKQVELTKKQYSVGLAPQTDLLQAQTLLESTRTQLVDTRRQRANLEHALAVLIGKAPSELTITEAPLTAEVPDIPSGLPAEVLARRPDVAAAEHRLVAANADIGVAKANFYPKFMLTGSAGFASINTGRITEWESRLWSLAPSLEIPIFQGGRLNAELDQARASHAEAVARFRSSVLVALREVEDSLNDLHRRAEAFESRERTLDSARETFRLAEIQYRNGLANYLLVIDTARTLLDNELAAAELRNQRLVSSVQLIRALGGGWKPGAPIHFDPVEESEPTEKPASEA